MESDLSKSPTYIEAPVSASRTYKYKEFPVSMSPTWMEVTVFSKSTYIIISSIFC